MRGYIYVEITFNMMYLNKIKAIKELILREEEEERNVGFLEDPQWSFQAECQGTMPLEGFGESEEENYISILSKLETYN